MQDAMEEEVSAPRPIRDRIPLAALAAALALLALAAFTPDAGADEPADDTRRATYAEAVAALEARRVALGARWTAAQDDAEARTALLAEARTAVFDAMTGELIPAWYGTPWDFNGMIEQPGTGAIACGTFVSTIIGAAGFRVERIELGIQASELIVRSFAKRDRVKTLWKVPIADVVADVEARGKGIYPVGLSFHTGLLVHDGENVRFCHSAYYGDGRVVCEDAATSPGLEHSNIFVIGPLMTDWTMARWLEGEKIPTHGL
jgi:hypothetical protein